MDSQRKQRIYDYLQSFWERLENCLQATRNVMILFQVFSNSHIFVRSTSVPTAIASHGVLDAMTNGGLGLAFFAPFDNTRYFFPFRPIEVSPLSVDAFFSASGAAILTNEFLWIWLHWLFITALLFIGRLRQATGHSATARSSNAASSQHLL